MRTDTMARWMRERTPFSRLPQDALRALVSCLRPRAFEAGERLIRQGDPGDSVLFLTGGRVRVVVRRREDEVVLAELGAGDVVGEMALVTGAPRNADVVAVTEGTLLSLGANEFRAVSRTVPDLTEILTAIVSDRLGRAAADGLGDKVLEGYRVLRVVGSGASSVVYLAEREEDGEAVALKMLRHVFVRDEDAVHRFEREAALLRGVPCDGIANCRGRFSAYGTIFLVMDFVDGASLSDVLRTTGPLSTEEAAGVWCGVGDALRTVHDRGVVHRDLKPANVLLDGTGAPRLTDFGIARRLADNGLLAETGTAIAGTPHYMPPEVFDGAPATAAADVYALGCMLWEMTTGEPLFDGPDVAAILERKRTFRPAGAAERIARADPFLGEAFLRAMRTDPAERELLFPDGERPPAASRAVAPLRAPSPTGEDAPPADRASHGPADPAGNGPDERGCPPERTMRRGSVDPRRIRAARA